MAERDERQACGDCRHYEWAGPIAGWGECRRFPPTLLPVTVANAGDDEHRSRHPCVKKHHWCGEFSAAVTPTTDRS